jgi:predicted ATPase/DNA-binding CsgD family transcriptional regulator
MPFRHCSVVEYWFRLSMMTNSRSGDQLQPLPKAAREAELATAIKLLRRNDVRLLTLTGPGGIGKTRLSIEIGGRMGAAFGAGVRVVSLAPVPHSGLVATTIARALQIVESGSVEVGDSLAFALRDSHMLLILDNFEHVLAAAPLVTNLLVVCPYLKVLATSRASLRVTGEHIPPVPPLALPDARTTTPTEHLAQAAAVQLFVDRARAVAPSFNLTATTMPIVAAICQHLDGVPLGIEIAAAQSGILPPAALLARIEARPPLPHAGPRDAPKRLRSMRDTIAWSYAYLPVDVQQLFRIVAVFAGSFSLDAAEAVGERFYEVSRASVEEAVPDGSDTLSPRPSPVHDIHGGLASLVDNSLVQQKEWDGEARFSMLETIRDFAVEQLVACGENDADREAHAAWCLELAEQSQMASVIPGGEQELSRLEIEHPNMRAALHWLHQRGDSDRLLRLATALGGFWFVHNHYREGREWLELALADSSATPDTLRAPALVKLELLLGFQTNTKRAEELFAEGIRLLRVSGDAAAIALALVWQGAIANYLGEHERAERVLEEALGQAEQIPDASIAASMTARALVNLGISAHLQGKFEVAIVRHELALRVCREHGYVLGTIRSLRDRGDVARDQGDYTASLAYYRECLTLMGDRGDRRIVVDAILGAALAAAVWDQPERAARLIGAADAIADHFGATARVATDQAAHKRVLALIHATMEEQEFETAWTIGRALDAGTAIAEVLAMSPSIAGTRKAVDPSHIHLSRREEEVLRLVSAGQSDREIAEELFLSVRTVEAHVTRIRTNLGVRTRTAAVTAAIAAGLMYPVAPQSD